MLSTATVLVVVVVIDVIVRLTSSSPAPTLTDADRVFCLSDAQQSALSGAAASLHAILPATPRSSDPVFVKVCTALVASAQLPQQQQSQQNSPFVTTLNVLLPLVVGAALSWLPGYWQEERKQSRLLADTVQSAARKYFDAAEAMGRRQATANQGKLPVDQAVLDNRSDLMAQLRRVEILRNGWTVPQRLRELLADERLGVEMNDSQPGHDTAAVLKDKLDAVRPLVNDVVQALERPWRWHPEMRQEHAALPGAAGA